MRAGFPSTSVLIIPHSGISKRKIYSESGRFRCGMKSSINYVVDNV